MANEITEINDAIELLERYNNWRRGIEGYDQVPPAMLGKAIDKAVGVMRLVANLDESDDK